VPSAEFPEPNFEALRLRLSMLRHERNWTYDALAEHSGVSRRSLVALETGDKVRPSNGSVETWYRLAKAFGIPIGDLLGALNDDSK